MFDVFFGQFWSNPPRPDTTTYLVWLFGFVVKTELQNSGALSRLYIANAAKKDSGNYTCALEEVSATTVAVHVLRGENPLAMQRGDSSQLRPFAFSSLLILYLLTR